MSASLDQIARLSVEIQPRVLGITGIRQLDQFMAKVEKGNKGQVAQAKLAADASIREQQRAARSFETLTLKQGRLSESLAKTEIRQAEAAASGRIAAYRRATLEIESLNKRVAASNVEAFNAGQRVQSTTKAAGTAQRDLTRTQLLGNVAGGLSMAGTGFLGVGAVGLGLGALTLGPTLKWQSYSAQTQANSPVSAQAFKRFQALALSQAAKTGANPDDILLALRYGAEMGLSPTQDKRYLTSALALGLPTGGTSAIAPSLKALATMRTNFPGLGGNPHAIANMVLAASQNAAGVNVADFVGAIPQILSMAGHIGGNIQAPDVLAMVAAMTQAGIPLDEAQTQIKNFLKVLITGGTRPGTQTYKTLTALQQQHGINLFPDFTQQGLQKKGLAGVVNDLTDAHLSQATILSLFPNMRGMLAAMGLTGNLNKNFNNILNNPNTGILASNQNNPLGANMQRYLGLDPTQAKILVQQLHTLAITLGTELMPSFNALLKNDVVPLVKELAAFIKNNQGVIDQFIKMAPWLISIGGGLRLMSGGVNLVNAGLRGEGMIGLLITMRAALMGIGGAGGAAAFVTEALAGNKGVAGAAGKAKTEVLALSKASSGLTLSGMAGPLAGLAALAGAFYLLQGKADAAAAAIDKVAKHAGLGTQPFGPQGPDIGTMLWGLLAGPIVGHQSYSELMTYITTGKFPGTGGSTKGKRGSGGYGAGGVASPAGLSGGMFGNFGQVSGNSDASYFGAGARDIDFNNSTGQPRAWTLPGGQNDQWTFKKWVKDTSGKGGGYGQEWVTPQGHTVLLWHQDPRGAPSFGSFGSTTWHKWKSGDKASGGQLAGMTTGLGSDQGAHLCLVVTPQGAFDLMQLTYGQQQVYKHLGYGTIQLTKWEQAHLKDIMAVAQSTGVPLSALLATLQMESSGGMNPAAGSNVMQVTKPAWQQLGYKSGPQNWQQSLKMGAQYLESQYNRTGSWQSAFADYNGSAAYGRTAMALMKQYAGFDYGIGSGQSSGGNGVSVTIGGTKKKTMSASQAQGFFTMLTKPYTRSDGTIDFQRMPPDQRLAADNLLRLVNSSKLHALGKSLNDDVAAGYPKSSADQIYATAAKSNAGWQSDPEKTYNTSHAPKAKSASQWHSYWSARQSRDAKALTEILKQYTDPTTGRVNFAAMPANVRKAVNSLIQQVGADQYMADRATYNADIKSPGVRGPLMTSAWNSFMSEYRHPEAAHTLSLLGLPASLAGGTGASAGAQAWHVIGRNCEAAQHALGPAKDTAAHTKGIGNTLRSHTPLFRSMATDLNILVKHLVPAAKGAKRGGGMTFSARAAANKGVSLMQAFGS